jgi:hypothetical protein
MKHPSKITLLIIGLLLVSSLTVLTQTINAKQQENENNITAIDTINAEAYQTLENLVATPFYCSPFAGTSNPTGYSPNQIRNAYNLPSSGGIGKTIAIIDAFHAPTLLTDYTAFCKEFNLPNNSSGTLLVHTMPGATVNASWLPETCLDVEWAHAIAPNATILLVEAKDAKVSSLFDAVEYATGQSDVVAISMSWGLSESYLTKNDETYLDNNYFNKANIIFFASSGDSGAEINYPAVSPNVVGVGGTKLLFNSDGTLKSETAWSGSGGGVSLYESQPSYQTNYGVNTTKRCVPDVSYNADPNTGVSVYCDGSWKVYGGTSAGAPQWAAIHALSLSASNSNLYDRAKTAYTSYFRDIISGSNGNPAKTGYDYVTGLGSPLTFDFNDRLEVYPISGGTGTNITITGKGLLGTSANITYLNPLTSTWESIANNTAITSGSLSYNTTAPDLMGTIASGDNLQTADQIIFRVTNNTGYSYNTTVPFSEYRRGLSQVGNLATANIFGNNTTFGTAILPKSGNNLSLSGRWFTPGNVTLLWDTTNLGNATVDQTGTFSTNITVPTSVAGYHTLTIQDNAYNFSINIASQPTLTHDYNGQWQTSDFTINLSADSTVDTIYYRINNGTTQNMTEVGQPVITTSSSNNTLEYWCNWTLNGVSLETTHIFVANIKLDKTAPTGQVMADPTTSIRQVTLHLSAVDTESGVTQMCFSNDGIVFSGWEQYAPTYSWTLTGVEGSKMVVAKFMNGAGTTSLPVAVEITLDLPDATTAPQATTSTNPTAAPQTQTSIPTNSPTDDPTATPVPEFPFGAALLLLALTSLLLVLIAKRRQVSLY